MLLTPHTIVGVAIGSLVPETAVAVPVSFAMHFMGDLVPHWDFYTDTTAEQRITGWRPLAVMADLACGIGIGMFFTLYALWVMHNPYLALRIFLCGIAAVLPDALGAPTLYKDKTNPISQLIGKIQSKLQISASLPWGIFTQIIVMIIAFLMLSNSLGL